MSFLDRIGECSVFDPSRYRPFRVGNVNVGLVTDDVAGRLAEFTDVFRVAEDEVALCDDLRSVEERTAAVERVLKTLAERGLLSGWRNEHYVVATSFNEPALFHMERAAVPLFGIKAFDVHLNGYVPDGEGLKMWVARRSMTKPTGAGKLDQLVAGGQPAGMSHKDNLIKECGEEAGLPAGLAEKAVEVGKIRYVTERPEGLHRDELTIFDLEVPADFTPVNTDGEVDTFYLWPIEKVIETVRDSTAFKFNCALVVIDFLIRHGFIEPDHPEYARLVEGLDQPLGRAGPARRSKAADA